MDEFEMEQMHDGIDTLRAEIERLREECHTLRLWAEEAARAENANAEDAKQERTAVVAWLLERADRVWHADAERAIVREAYAIERGDHRREEKS